MKALERTKEIKEIYGYESDDGTYFKTEEECKKYEETARYAVDKAFWKLCVKQNINDKTGMFPECGIFENFGYGSDEFALVILEVKNEEDMKIVNMYKKMHLVHSSLDDDRYEIKEEHIGKRILVGLGTHYEGYDNFYVYGTLDELVEKFTHDMYKFFYPTTKENNSNITE